MKKFEYKTYVSKYEDLLDWDDTTDRYYKDSDSNEIKNIKKKVSNSALGQGITTQDYILLEELNFLGNEGWELVSTIKEDQDIIFYFKREI